MYLKKKMYIVVLVCSLDIKSQYTCNNVRNRSNIGLKTTDDKGETETGQQD